MAKVIRLAKTKKQLIIGKGDVERVGYLSEETTKLIRRYLRERSRPK